MRLFCIRTAFEMWYAEQYFDHPMPDEFDRFEDTNEGPSGVYRYGDVRLAWDSWQAGISWMQNAGGDAHGNR
jgi:hypothetical protein